MHKGQEANEGECLKGVGESQMRVYDWGIRHKASLMKRSGLSKKSKGNRLKGNWGKREAKAAAGRKYEDTERN